MTSEGEERPRLVTGGYGRHRSQWVKKAKKRLYSLSQLKRSGLGTRELVQFFCTCIRPITEYACPVFHDGLSMEQFLRATWNFFQASRIKNQLLFGYIYLLDGNITDSIWQVQSLLILALSI